MEYVVPVRWRRMVTLRLSALRSGSRTFAADVGGRPRQLAGRFLAATVRPTNRRRVEYALTAGRRNRWSQQFQLVRWAKAKITRA